MAGLSSMTSTRRFTIATESGMTGLHGCQRQIEGKHGASPGARAVCTQLATEFPGRQRAAVQSEPVTVFLRREAVIEDPGQVLGGDADAVVLHADSSPQLAAVD